MEFEADLCRGLCKSPKRFEGFDWTKSHSILAAYGGMKGVYEAREILLNYITKKDG